MKKKCLSLLLMVTATMLLLAGCSFGKPTAADIIAKSQKESMDNYHMDGTMDFSIKLSADGGDAGRMSFDVPISVDFDIDAVDEQTHGAATMKISIMGSSDKMEMEFYTDGDDRYIRGDDGQWTNSETELDFAVQNSMAADCFTNAEVTYDKAAGTYTITDSLKGLLENKEFRKSMEDCFDITDAMAGSVDVDDLLDDFANGKVTMVVDSKSYNILRFTIDDICIETTVNEDGAAMDLNFEMAFDLKFSEFGEIDEDDVVVPESVKNSAVEKADIWTAPDMSINVGGESDADNAGNMFSGNTNQDIEDVPVAAPAVKQGSDVLGSLNGTAFVNGCGNWDSTFGADGWVLDETTDGKYSFIVADNPKYEGADLCVTSSQAANTSLNNSTIADLEANGFCGYDIDVSYATNKPNMTWNGLTFGASAEQIQAVYGAPDNIYEGSLYTSYDYDISDSTTLTFYVHGADGLQEVQCMIFN